MIEWIAALFFLAGAISTGIVFFIIRHCEHRREILEKQIAELTANIEKLDDEIKQVRQVQRKRHTHRTAAGIEDATAGMIDILFAERAHYKRMAQILGILQELREGPDSYDPDRPSGKRPKDF